MIVGSFHGVDERRPAMAGAERMTIEEVVRKVLCEEHGDVIRESVRAVAQELMEAEVSELVGAQRGKHGGPRDASQRLPTAAVGHARRRDRVADSEDPSGQLLSELPAAAQAQ
jgi:hypothetical protein